MGGLHRMNYIEISERSKIVRINHLGMFNAPALVVFTFQEFRINLQHSPHSRVPVEKKTNPEDTVKAALEMRDFVLAGKQKKIAEGKPFLK